MMILALLTSVLLDATPMKIVTDKPGNDSTYFIDSDHLNKKLLLELINNIRNKGCTCGNVYYAPAPPLEWNDQLEKAAKEHCIDMYTKNYFSHVGSDGSKPGTRIEQAGYVWRNYGENIGMGYKSEEEVIKGWLNSPHHCQNIMDKVFKDMAIARVGDYWTQDLGVKK